MAEIQLELTPKSRFDIIDVTKHIETQHDNFFAEYNKAVYCSYHTTAGYLEQSLCDKLDHNSDSVKNFLSPFQELFPPRANYRHDNMLLRSELTEEQKLVEPLNGDSHLTYISSGLENCVTYLNKPNTPVYFIDLDGVCDGRARTRKTTIYGYNSEELVSIVPMSIPVSGHRIDSVNLRDPRLGIFEQLQETVQQYGIERGRIEIVLAPEEDHVALTVNEFETLLMQYDVADILSNPMRFMAQKSWNMLRDPKTVPMKMLNYAKYDLVHIVNKTLDKLNMSSSMVGRGIQRLLANKAAKALRMKRVVSLLVSEAPGQQKPGIVSGTYQSPIMIQWHAKPNNTRRLEAAIYRFI